MDDRTPHRATSAELRAFRAELRNGWAQLADSTERSLQVSAARRGGSYSPTMFAPWHLDGSDGEPWLYLSRHRVMTDQHAYRAYRQGIDESDHDAGDHPDYEGRGCHLCAAEYHAELCHCERYPVEPGAGCPQCSGNTVAAR